MGALFEQNGFIRCLHTLSSSQESPNKSVDTQNLHTKQYTKSICIYAKRENKENIFSEMFYLFIV